MSLPQERHDPSDENQSAFSRRDIPGQPEPTSSNPDRARFSAPSTPWRADMDTSRAMATPPVPLAKATSGMLSARQDDPVEDPLVDTDASWFVQFASGDQYGPMASKLLRAWIETGRLAPDALVRRDGWSDWRSAAAVFPQLRQQHPQEQPSKAPLPLGDSTATRAVLLNKTAASSGELQQESQPLTVPPPVKLRTSPAASSIVIENPPPPAGFDNGLTNARSQTFFTLEKSTGQTGRVALGPGLSVPRSLIAIAGFIISSALGLLIGYWLVTRLFPQSWLLRLW